MNNLYGNESNPQVWPDFFFHAKWDDRFRQWFKYSSETPVRCVWRCSQLWIAGGNSGYITVAALARSHCDKHINVNRLELIIMLCCEPSHCDKISTTMWTELCNRLIYLRRIKDQSSLSCSLFSVHDIVHSIAVNLSYCSQTEL